jgi:hypothetical protein
MKSKLQGPLNVATIGLLLLGSLACSKKEFAQLPTEIATPSLVLGGPPKPSPIGCLFVSELQNGSVEKPWQVDSCQCFQDIETNPKDSLRSHHFKLVSDLNCSDLSGGYKSISWLTGVLDGDGHQIANLTFKQSSPALIDRLYASGKIKNLSLLNVQTSASPGPGAIHAAVAQYTSSQSEIENVQVSLSKIQGISVGGLVGYLGGLLKNSSFKGSLDAVTAGGLVYSTFESGRIEDSTFEGTIDFKSMASGGIFSHAGTANNLQTKVNLNYVGTSTDFTATVGAGGLIFSNKVTSTTGTHYGKLKNSKVLTGSSLTADLSGVAHAYFGGVAASQFAELENIQAHMDVSLISSSPRQAYVLVGGIAGLCYPETARNNQIQATGTFASRGIRFENSGPSNVSRKSSTWAMTQGTQACHENQIQSNF